MGRRRGADDRVMAHRGQQLAGDGLRQVGRRPRQDGLEVCVRQDGVGLLLLLHGDGDGVVEGRSLRDQGAALTQTLDLQFVRHLQEGLQRVLRNVDLSKNPR